jgi:hypothetical protein
MGSWNMVSCRHTNVTVQPTRIRIRRNTMTAQTVSQMSTILRQMIARYRWIGALGVLIVVAALVAYRFASAPVAPTPAVARAQASLVEPAAQSVLDYLHAHGAVQPLPTSVMSLDPAQQSVLSYLRAHESVERSRAPWDPAVQAVLDYLRAHSR